ncbi:peptidoglycan-binding protein [Microcoleus sp. D2_18a_D3]|uniref:peptidoglycan-binding protein n=1 Tax=Microcoleus sp. D2_18a_D3 TaxID=3055330 RepID=UPI002FD77431
MDTLGCIQAWLIWEKQEEQSEVPEIQISAIPGLLILILILTPLIDLHPVLAAQLLARGSRGQDIVALQNDLKQAGCFPQRVRSTGYYGKITKAAVQKLQQTHGLRVDGVVGEQTRNALDSGKTCQSLASSGVLKMGSRGEKVRQLQSQLNNWGFPVKKVDGVFGKETREAVIRFQNYHGLKPDGIVGPKTAKVLWTPRTQVSQANTTQVSYDSDTYEQAFVEVISDPENVIEQGQDVLYIKSKNFEIIKSAIFDENLDKKTRYRAAIFLARKIYAENFHKNWLDFQKEPKNCKSRSCIDKPNIYRIDSVLIGEKREQVPIDEIRLILNEAANQEEDLVNRFLAASAMAYIRENPTKNIINILKEELETNKVSNILNLEEKTTSNTNSENGDSTPEINTNSMSTQALESLDIFSEYANDSSYFEDTIPVLNELMRDSKNSESGNAAIILGKIAAIGNDIAFQHLISLFESDKKLESNSIFPIEVATKNIIVAQKMSKKNKNSIKLLKDLITQESNKDNRLQVGLAASILISVGEEEFIINLLGQDKTDKMNFELKLELAETLYNESKNDKSKEKALETIIDLYKKNPKWDLDIILEKNDVPRYPACILYSIGQPAVKGLEQLMQENPNLKTDVNRLLDSINNQISETPCNEAGGGMGWVISRIFGGRKK